MSLPYAGSVECGWDDGWGEKGDVWPCGFPAVYIDKNDRYCYEEHFPLVFVAGFDPKPLPEEPEILASMRQEK